MNNMGDLMNDMDAELLKKWRAVSSEQRAEEERLRQIQRDWEAAHTAIETDEDRADPEKYPQEDDE
jgi:uncharacterized protein